MRYDLDRNKTNRSQLDRVLDMLKPLRNVVTPQHGWVREIRQALGMTGVQLAGRLGMAQSSLVNLEAGEVAGTVTLNTLRKAAAALDCTLIYALVPNGSLTGMVELQAEKVARGIVSEVGHTMALEAQSEGAADPHELTSDIV